MKKRIKYSISFFILLLVLSAMSCSKLPTYQMDEFDDKTVNKSDESLGSDFDRWEFDQGKVSEKINDDSFVSEGTKYYLMFNVQIPIGFSVTAGDQSIIYYESNNDTKESFLDTSFLCLDKKEGYNWLKSFWLRISCNHKKGNINIYTLRFRYISYAYEGELVDKELRYEHFINNDTLKDKYYSQKYITNIYYNDILIGKVGYHFYNNKTDTKYIESLFNNNTKMISLEDMKQC